MSPWRQGAALIAIALMSGCFHATQYLDTQVEPVSELLSTHAEDVIVPGTEVVTVASTLNGAMLAVEATLRAQCRPTTFETWQNYDKTVVSLPWGHWFVLGAGLGAAGGGGTALSLGAIDVMNTPADNQIHKPSVEEKRDTGQTMMIAGGVIAGVGLLLLTSELVDAILVEDSRQPTDRVIKPIQGPTKACDDAPAGGHPIYLETPPSGDRLAKRVTVMTDGFGRAVIDLRSPDFKDFPYGDPFAVMSCEHCTGWNLSLMPEGIAELAIHRGDLEALRHWMERHGDHAKSEIVARVLEATKRREVVDLGDAVTFDTGSSRLRSSAGAHLDRTAEFLLKRRNLQLRIEGHTDNSGAERKNRNLSRQRAEAVKKYLMQRGVPADRLITVGMASSRPVSSNRTEAGRRANRRYHFELLED